MRLPQTFLSSIINSSPSAIVEDRAYVNFPSQNNKNFLEIRKGKKIPLQESDTLNFFEKYYFQTNRRELELIQSQLVNGVLKIEKDARKNLYDLISQNNVLDFIVNKVFPCNEPENKKNIEKVIGRADNGNNAYNSNNRNNESNAYNGNNGYCGNNGNGLDSMLAFNTRLKDILSKTNLENLIVFDFSTLAEVASGLLFYDNKVWEIKPNKNPSWPILVINEKAYSLENKGILPESLENEYQDKLLKKLTLSAIKGNQSLLNQVKEIQQDKNKILQFLDKDKFEKGEIGFEKINGSYWVYLKIIEPFTIQYIGEVSRTYPPCRVGIRINAVNPSESYKTLPVVMEPYSHPLLPHLSQPLQFICHRHDKSGFTSFLSKLPEGKREYAMLMEGVNSLKFGVRSGGRYYQHM